MRTHIFALLLVPGISLAQDPPPSGFYDVIDILGYGKDGPEGGSVTGSDGADRFVGHFIKGSSTVGFIYNHNTGLTTQLGNKRPKRMRPDGSWVGADHGLPGATVAITGIGAVTQELVMPGGASQAWAEDSDGSGKVVGTAVVSGAMKPVLWTNGTPSYLTFTT